MECYRNSSVNLFINSSKWYSSGNSLRKSATNFFKNLSSNSDFLLGILWKILHLGYFLGFVQGFLKIRNSLANSLEIFPEENIQASYWKLSQKLLKKHKEFIINFRRWRNVSKSFIMDSSRNSDMIFFSGSSRIPENPRVVQTKVSSRIAPDIGLCILPRIQQWFSHRIHLGISSRIITGLHLIFFSQIHTCLSISFSIYSCTDLSRNSFKNHRKLF